MLSSCFLFCARTDLKAECGDASTTRSGCCANDGMGAALAQALLCRSSSGMPNACRCIMELYMSLVSSTLTDVCQPPGGPATCCRTEILSPGAEEHWTRGMLRREYGMC